MFELLTVSSFPVESALYRSCPQTAIRLNIHGIDRTGRDRCRHPCLVNIVTQQQGAWRQFGNARSLGTNPYLAVAHHQAMHEITGQRQIIRIAVPMLKGIHLV